MFCPDPGSSAAAGDADVYLPGLEGTTGRVYFLRVVLLFLQARSLLQWEVSCGCCVVAATSFCPKVFMELPFRVISWIIFFSSVQTVVVFHFHVAKHRNI